MDARISFFAQASRAMRQIVRDKRNLRPRVHEHAIGIEWVTRQAEFEDHITACLTRYWNEFERADKF